MASPRGDLAGLYTNVTNMTNDSVKCHLKRVNKIAIMLVCCFYIQSYEKANWC